MNRRWWSWVRPLVGVAILAVLVWRLGSGPFLAGIDMVDGWSLVAALLLTALATLCSAWRWSIVARGLGVPVTLRAAVLAYYRSLFLNTTLPGGVLGDVDRGLRHGRRAGDTGAGLRAVAWERLAGQVVQVALALTVLLLLPSPWRASMPTVVVIAIAMTVGAVLAERRLSRDGLSPWAHTVRTVSADLRGGLLDARAWPGIVVASLGAVTGHVLTFLVAARTAGSDASLTQLLPLAMLVLLAMSVPANVAGWGPREGVAAWAFAAVGLGAAQGVAVAVVYGVMGLVACLPGAMVLAAATPTRAHARLEGAARG